MHENCIAAVFSALYERLQCAAVASVSRRQRGGDLPSFIKSPGYSRVLRRRERGGTRSHCSAHPRRSGGGWSRKGDLQVDEEMGVDGTETVLRRTELRVPQCNAPDSAVHTRYSTTMISSHFDIFDAHLPAASPKANASHRLFKRAFAYIDE